MVYLSGTRANNVGDEAEEYYEDEFEHLVYDMRHADDADHVLYYLGEFREFHEHFVFPLTPERVGELRRVLIREFGEGVLVLFKLVFNYQVMEEWEALIERERYGTFHKVVVEIKRFKSMHVLKSWAIKRMQRILWDKCPPDPRHAELLYAFQEVFPVIAGGFHLVEDELYQVIVDGLTVGHLGHVGALEEVMEAFETIKSECNFDRSRLEKLKDELDRECSVSRFHYTMYIEAFQRVFPEVNHGYRVDRGFHALTDAMEDFVHEMNYMEYPDILRLLKRFRGRHVLTELDAGRFKAILAAEMKDDVEIKYAFQRVYPDLRVWDRVYSEEDLCDSTVSRLTKLGKEEVIELMEELKNECDFNEGIGRKLREALVRNRRLHRRHAEFMAAFGKVFGGRV
jgi:hypothetical protein